MLRRTGFLAASAAMGCWFACWTPEAAGVPFGGGSGEVCPAAQAIILDAPQAMAELTGDPLIPQYIDGELVKVVVKTTTFSMVKVGENDWFIGFTDPAGEFFWPLMNIGLGLEMSGDWTFEVPGGPPSMGHPLAVLDGWYIVGEDLCEGIQCEMKDGSVGGWVPCDDPDVLDAIEDYKACVKNAIGSDDEVDPADIAILLGVIACVGGVVVWPLWLACLALMGVGIWAKYDAVQKAMFNCWLNYKREFRQAMREHCDGLQIDPDDILVPDYLSDNPCDISYQHP